MPALHFVTTFTLSAALLASVPYMAQGAALQAAVNLQPEKTLIQQGRLDEAKAMTLDELHRSPSAASFNLLGIIDSQQQNYPDALVAFANALHFAPKSTETRNNIGNVYLLQKKLALAEEEFRSVLSIDPHNQNANYNLAILLMAKGSPAESIRYFERIHPQTLETRFGLIRAYLQIHRTPEALSLAAQLSSEKPNDVQLHYSLGVLLAAEQQYKAAQLELERANILQPGTFEILFNLGQVELRNGDNKNADVALSRALTLKPDSTETMYLLAQGYIHELRPLDALELLVRANKLAPQNSAILYLMAQVSISQKYYEDAIPLLRSAIQIDPRNIDLHESLAECLFHADEMDQSIEELKATIGIQPSARAYSFLGLAHTHLGRFDEATEYFRKALSLDPHNIFCLFQLGYIAREKGDSASAEATFEKILQVNPNYPYALLELANIQIEHRRFYEAQVLLKNYTRVSNNPVTGYYKLAMVEEQLHNTDAAKNDLAQFQTLSQNSSVTAHPYDDLFAYLNNRSTLVASAKAQQDVVALTEQLQMHPGQHEILYGLAKGYLEEGKVDDAESTIAQLDKDHPDDATSLMDGGVLLARYGLYSDAIQQFLAALHAKPGSDDISFNLADAYFHKGLYADALDTAMQVSDKGRKDDAYLALLGDIYAHLGDSVRAIDLFQSAIKRNPDNDQDYLSLALLELRENDISAAKHILLQGQTRVPGSGKLIWGLGLANALEGNTDDAVRQLERALEILPEWPGAYSTLGVFYYQIGQIAKAQEVLDRFKNSGMRGGLDISRIEETLAQAPVTAPTGNQPLSSAQRAQLLQIALFLADKSM